MTTAFAHAAQLHPWDAVIAQPFGALLALATGVFFWLSLHAAITGSRALTMAGSLFRPLTWWGLGAVFVGSWVYKMETWPG